MRSLSCLLALSWAWGGRNLNEDTFAMMTALHLLATVGADKIITLTWKARLEHNQLTKREFRRREKGVMPPSIAVKVLPPEPSMFQAEYPE